MHEDKKLSNKENTPSKNKIVIRNLCDMALFLIWAVIVVVLLVYYFMHAPQHDNKDLEKLLQESHNAKTGLIFVTLGSLGSMMRSYLIEKGWSENRFTKDGWFWVSIILIVVGFACYIW